MLHSSHSEQGELELLGQADDLLRLSRASNAEASVRVRVRYEEGTSAVTTWITLTASHAQTQLHYRGAAKYLSTHLHVAVARVLRRPDRPRLAWLWSDQGTWLTGLADGSIDTLNAALGLTSSNGWSWVDEADPIAAGDDLPGSAGADDPG